MMLRQIWLLGVAACATGSVFAQQAAPAEPAPAAPQAATPAPAAEKSNSPLEGELDADKIMAAQKAGYTIKNENGQTLLCRRDLQTGSRLRHKTSCMTAREWEQLQAENEMQLKSLERRPRVSKQ